MLAENPSNWTTRKFKRVNFSTFFNQLDWEATKKYGIIPVEKAPNRRCEQPFRTVNVGFDGTYSFCCFDFMRHIYGKIGSVNEGLDGFFKFWLGNYMQKTRKLLHFKDRNSHELCNKCSFTSGRCDIPCWSDNCMNKYWDGENWKSTDIKIKKDLSLEKFFK